MLPSVLFSQRSCYANSTSSELGTDQTCNRYGVRVNTISPGYMDTELNEGPGLEEVRQSWESRNPMGRLGQVGELDGVVVLLCSPAGSYITGADFVVDGEFLDNLVETVMMTRSHADILMQAVPRSSDAGSAHESVDEPSVGDDKMGLI